MNIPVTSPMAASVSDALDRMPRARLGHAPTPIDSMPRMAEELGLAGLTVKRDDCTGLAFGGNKVRQLEFYLGNAVAQNADTVLITGAVQSNFVRLAAAGARSLGMDIHIQLEERVPNQTALYHESGNVLLDKILGATLHSYPDGEDESGADRRLGEIADSLRQEGKSPYIIPLAPGHAPLGALGYVVAARELMEQFDSQGFTPDEIVLASGSGHTHGGLLFGLKAYGCTATVSGICVRRPRDAQVPRITSRCQEIADLLGVANPVSDTDINIYDDVLAPGYGQMNDATRAAIKMSAQSEALILDPVYTAKAMAGLIVRAREAAPGTSMMFIHTGGTPALFGYAPEYFGL